MDLLCLKEKGSSVCRSCVNEKEITHCLIVPQLQLRVLSQQHRKSTAVSNFLSLTVSNECINLVYTLLL